MAKIKRISTNKVMVGKVQIGNQNKVVIQSMTNTKTSDIDKTLKQIKELQSVGCEIVRLSVCDQEDVNSLKIIKNKTTCPIIADIHFDYRLALGAIKAGVDKVRINPGNIGSKEVIKEIVDLCKKNNVPIRIGVNSGSLDKDIEKKFGSGGIAMVESAKKHIKILEDLDFKNIVVSMKSSNPKVLRKAVKTYAIKYSYPLHLGVTEAGDYLQAVVKSAYGLTPLIAKGFGDTIRVSITGDPVKEIEVAKEILKVGGIKKGLNIISCPTCGRTKINLEPIIKTLRQKITCIDFDLTIAIMGCVVNGPGEAKHADIGIAGGDNKVVLFKKGKVVKTISENDVVSELLSGVEEIKKMHK